MAFAAIEIFETFERWLAGNWSRSSKFACLRAQINDQRFSLHNGRQITYLGLSSRGPVPVSRMKMLKLADRSGSLSLKRVDRYVEGALRAILLASPITE